MSPQRALEQFVVGEQAEFSRTFTESEVTQFVGLSWDVNPFHTDDEFCKTHRVGKRIVPGLLIGSMLTHIGGLAAVLASHASFEFLAPVYIGDTVTATCTVVEADATRGWARFEMRGVNQRGELVVRGEARGYPMRWRDRLRRASE
ncbi:MAG: MaoC family dehydratase [Chloroflexi bacterium]|nr:MaoC family dehydratase [Chloroflexota bacterium]